MWPFRKRAFLPPEYIEWQLHTYAWLLRNFGGYERFKSTQLITPTAEFFPESSLQGPDVAQSVFDKVRSLVGMSTWPCQLEPQDPDNDDNDAATSGIRADGALIDAARLPRGAFTYLEQDGIATALIGYDPALTKNPMDLVATFAHELGHYLLNCAREAPPGGWEIIELANDLTAVYLGFGIFSANSAFQLGQFGQSASAGWQGNRQGHLSETSLLFALALFTRLTNVDAALVKPHLRENLVGIFDGALVELSSHERRILDLRAITPLARLANA
jgi:hypothetical protein